LVHYRSDYDNLTAAIADGQGNSLAVVGIFIQETMPWDQYHGVKDSETVDNLKMAANELSKPRRGPDVSYTDMEVLLDQFTSPITDLNGLYHYEGSLTTPSCDEVVQWIILDKPLHVKQNGLLQALRRNPDQYGNAIQDNYRPTQALNGRLVYHTAPKHVCVWSEWGPWGNLCNVTMTRNRTEAEPAMHRDANCAEHTSEMKIDNCTYYENDSGCVTEVNVTYNGNDISEAYLPDVPTCRSACRDNGTDYFTYSFFGSGGTNLCYCKSSDSGRVDRDGRESGKTSCTACECEENYLDCLRNLPEDCIADDPFPFELN